MNIKKFFNVLISSVFITYSIYEKFIYPEIQLPVIVSVLLIAVCCLSYKLLRIVNNAKYYHKIAYGLFAVFMIIGDSFKEYNSFLGIYKNPFETQDVLEKAFGTFSGYFNFLSGVTGTVLSILSSFSIAVGYYFIIKYFLECTKYILNKVLNKKDCCALYNMLEKYFLKEKTHIKVFFAFIIAWLPYLIIKFPATVPTDTCAQIEQFLSNEITTHHPFFVTVIYGLFASLGHGFGNVHIGYFLFTLIQYIAMAAAFSYSVYAMLMLNVNKKYIVLLIFLVAFLPVFPSFATTMMKDTLYSTAFTLFVVHMIVFLHGAQNGDFPVKSSLTLSLYGILVCLTRNNGVYIVIPTIIILVIYLLRQKRDVMKNVYKSILIIIVPAFVFCLYNHFQYDLFDIQRGSTREMLSIPFQQTARYVKEFPQDVDEEDKEIINKVLAYDNLAKLYNPVISDPVKATYKNNDEYLPEYFKVWFKHLCTHPLTYIEAATNTAYYAIYPDVENIRGYYFTDNSAFDGHNIKNNVSKMVRTVLYAFVIFLSALPIISCLTNVVLYVWLAIYSFIVCLFRKKTKLIITLVPLAIQLLTVFAGPCIYNHPRYLFPIYWSIIFIAGCILKENTVVEDGVII